MLMVLTEHALKGKTYVSVSLQDGRKILLWCSPGDLLNMGRLNRRTRELITPSLWTTVRDNVLGLPAPPTPTAQGYWGEEAYAHMLFGSSPCVVCGRVCSGFPHSFAVVFRVCGETCKNKILQPGSTGLDIHHWTSFAAAHAKSYEAIGFMPWLPLDHRDGDYVLPSAVESNFAELAQARRIEMVHDPNPLKFVRRTQQD
ncbi:hypothetical protein DFH06DRAFT_1334646 [Mycena polygramma]|nr:hypothetical protein DFH06DRAFT_1334646 [Mycena polygramma]